MVYRSRNDSCGIFVNKKGRLLPAVKESGLLLGGSSYGAGIGTGAAFDAGISIDHVLAVTLADSGYRALCSAGAAADAFIRNLVSHFLPPNTTIQKIAVIQIF